MNPTHVPGNEPDPGDMSTDPATGTATEPPGEHRASDDEAEKLGDFA